MAAWAAACAISPLLLVSYQGEVRMPSHEDTISALRTALSVSPNNIPLRRHLAQTLLSHGFGAEAIEEYLAALRLDPNDAQTKLGLAKSFLQQGKRSEAIVALEDVLNSSDAPGEAYIFHARMLLHDGEILNAVAQYKLGIEKDPACGDDALANELGIAPEPADEIFEGKIREASEDGPETSADIERPKCKFEDVGGMHALKEEIGLKIIFPLKHPDIYRAYGKPIGGGILMYGPPGCGKTHLARATAGEIEASFIAVGISDVLDMWIGSSERNLRQLFDNARANKPCVLFFDEVDALGGRRSDMRGGSGRQLINQFLSELDGIDQSNAGLLVLAATNAPWHMDPAFRRPGRFDRVLFVAPPDQEARASILNIHLKGKPLKDFDAEIVARKTDGFSGADLKALVDTAIEGKLREAFKTGVPGPITTKDLLAAAKKLKPSTREWFATARNYALYSNQDGMYDDITAYLKL